MIGKLMDRAICFVYDRAFDLVLGKAPEPPRYSFYHYNDEPNKGSRRTKATSPR